MRQQTEDYGSNGSNWQAFTYLHRPRLCTCVKVVLYISL